MITTPTIFIGLNKEAQRWVINQYAVGSSETDKIDFSLIDTKIINYFAEYYQVDPITITIKTNKEEKIIHIKKWVIHFLYETGKFTHENIKRKLGYTTISTVTYHISGMRFSIKNYDSFKKEYQIHLQNLKELFITFTPRN